MLSETFCNKSFKMVKTERTNFIIYKKSIKLKYSVEKHDINMVDAKGPSIEALGVLLLF